MKQRGAMELINIDLKNTELENTELVEAGRQAQTDLDAALARTLRRFIAEVSKADQPQAPSEASQRRAHPIREPGKRAAQLLRGRREGAS